MGKKAADLSAPPILGMIPPKMGTISNTSIADALFTQGQQRVLSTLFGQPDRSFYANEIVRLTSSGSGAVQRELQALESSGLVITSKRGNQKHYQANASSPIFEELRRLVAKTFGIADWVKRALEPLTDQIDYACIYGSVAKGNVHATSDIDLLVISDSLTLETIHEFMEPVEVQLGRRINPTLYTSAEFNKRRKAGQAFVTKVLAGERIAVIGVLDADS